MIIHPADVERIQAPTRSIRMLVSPQTTGTKELTLLYVEFEPGGGTDMHTHEGLEVMFVVRGTGKMDMGGKVRPFGEHDTLVADAGVSHQILNIGPETLLMANTFVPPLPDSFYERLQEQARKRSGE